MHATPADPPPPRVERPRWHALVALERPLVAGAVAFGVYLLLATVHAYVHEQGRWVSPFPYFNHLADAFLHGQTHLRILPEATHDLTRFAGKTYLYWSPAPAILLMPFVALFGVGFSDVVFTVVLGALDVVLVAALLRAAVAAGAVRLDRRRRAVLVTCFALGTVHLTLAPFGRVWFTSQLVGFAGVALAYLVALRMRGAAAFLLAGLCLATAAATRNNMVFTGFWPAWWMLRQASRGTPGTTGARWPRLAGLLALGVFPIAATVGLLALYNQVRFGAPLENGFHFHAMGEGFVADYRRYGGFSLHYLPRNILYQYITYPIPTRPTSVQGGGLFWMTPPFLAAFWGLSSRPRASVIALLLSIGVTSVPIFLLMGTGFLQWGPRYTLDFTVPLLLLTALGLRRWPLRWALLALLPAVGVYLFGAIGFSLTL